MSYAGAQQAREALGRRLRELRQDAGLSGRALATAAVWLPSKVSKIEHGRQTITRPDLETWARHCGAVNLLPDLVASLAALDTAFVEWRRIEAAGLRRAQESVAELYERTRHFRVYSPNLIPGIVQTQGYTRAILMAIGRRRSVPDDIEQAVSVRMERQQQLYRGDHKFAFLIEESALHVGLGGVDVMTGQLGHLLTVASLASVSLGIMPARADREAAWPVESFWMFDTEQVMVELVSGHLTVTQPSEVAMYGQVFAELADVAVYGAAARSLITAAIDKLADE